MTDLDFTNYTKFHIPDPLRYTWASYGTFNIVSSLIGDSIILLASIKYRAFKIHKFLVVIMQHISVCDILTSLNLILFIVSLVAERNILSPFLCYYRAYLTYYTFPVSFYLTAALTSSKLLLLKFPLREHYWTVRTAHVLCFSIWGFNLLSPILILVVDRDDVGYDFKEHACYYQFSSPHWDILRPLMGVAVSLFPFVVVMLTIGCLIMEARRIAQRGHDNLRWQGLIAVILTAVVYFLSILPMTVYHIVGEFVKEDPDGWFQVYYYRFSNAIICTNVMSNFYIYSLTLRSFREWLLCAASEAKSKIFGRKQVPPGLNLRATYLR